MKDRLAGAGRWYGAGAILLACLVACAGAQEPEPAPKAQPLPVGTVDGHVVDAETNLPLRFAQIRLVPKLSDADAFVERPRVMGPGGVSTPPARVQAVTGMSDIDGAFRMERVPAGDYLIGAMESGYVVPAPGITMNLKITPEQIKTLADSLPIVHVGVGQVATVNVSARRGAVIAGRVQFADGSPAIGFNVSCRTTADNDLQSNPGLRTWRASPLQQSLASFDSFGDRSRNSFVTDDEGQYRFSGLAPGKYNVTTVLVVNHAPALVELSGGGGGELNEEDVSLAVPEMVSVYSPGVFRLSEAAVIETHGSEQVLDADIKLDPSGLHTVRGRVLAGADGHPPTQILIWLKTDGSKDPKRLVAAHAGSFQIDYLPSGNYTMQIMANELSTNQTSPGTVPQEYKLVRMPIVIGGSDLDLSDILLVALKPGERNAAPEF
jgi:hypothetical protein